MGKRNHNLTITFWSKIFLQHSFREERKLWQCLKLVTFFLKVFLCKVVALSLSKAVSQWGGFLQLSWLHAPLKPVWASAVTNASARKHPGDKSSQEAIAGTRHRWELDISNIERNCMSNVKSMPGVSLRKLCRRKICFKCPETLAQRPAQQIYVSKILKVPGP